MPTVSRLTPYATTIFAEMSQLAVTHGAINLGQGFPDTDGPASMLAAACSQITGGNNQYPPGPGVPLLRQAVADHQSRCHGLDYDPDTEVLITVGATEAIAGSLVGLVEPGAEVVVIEPYYDAYAAATAMAGGVRRTVPLVADGDTFTLDRDALAATVSDRTAVLVLNSPHNPTGTVLSADDLQAIASVCIAHDVIVLSDEVYEHQVFDGRPHRSIATLPGMRERTLRISSAAKTFNVTGWKVGWVSGPAELVAATRTAKQFMSFVGSGPFQPAVTHALNTQMPWVHQAREDLARKRDLISEALRNIGFGVHHTAGTFFVCADPRPLGYRDGEQLCRDLPQRVGVAAVPVSAFVDNAEPWSHLVRFAFAKRDEVLTEAVARLQTLTD
ncbi:pyridoxal phosphate-dependent aminotransferase [Williamsia sp. CHRR-6]|uniref:pyridoxal phosphate-dependent aminotransferase n=1 Tax=Williamsia sp. CHRR-6 TaxID=2835871 RepID=UPI001BDACBB0|nr:pyridoxal phosphate-dependent aminotransferase [Williamsia sp. CHRR-6]MBT0566383.1 pyridoxal phosphate-dependent aminotransferase [Williamsia sp. CHRR-6]